MDLMRSHLTAACVAIAGIAILASSGCARRPSAAERAMEVFKADAPIHTRSKDLLVEIQRLAAEVNLFCQHPGWPQMAEILTARPSLEYVEGSNAAARKTGQALEAWSRKWQHPSDATLARYRGLKERSGLLNQKRQQQLDRKSVV